MYEEMITKKELIDAQVDARDLEKIINDAPEIQVQTRLGRYVWTLSTIEQRSFAKINEWQNAINTIVVNDGVPALAVSNANGKTQQEINDFGGAEWWNKPGGYELGATVKLENGDIVKSTVANNTINPNFDMTGWVNPSENQKKANAALGLAFYVEMWGAKGDGIAIDTIAATNAVNDLHNAYKADGMPRELLVQATKNYVGHLIPIKAGVSIRCPNGIATFTRTPVPAGTTESVAKWWRIFQVDASSFTTLADISNRVRIENLILDGNMYNSQWTWNTYNQEQASCLFLQGNPSISIGGVTQEWMRARFHVQNVKFQNSVSDGLHINRNVDLTFSNLEYEHCFRGGLTMTGGNSVIKGDTVTAFDARIDLEVDGGGIGGSYKAWIYLTNYWQDVAQTGKERFFTGGCDFASVAGGVLYLDNVNVLTPPFNMYIAKYVNENEDKFEISNSVFHSTAENIYNPTNGLFKNTKIVLRNDIRSNVTLPFLLAYNGYTQNKSQDLIFDGLTVEHFDPAITATLAMVRIESQRAANLQRLKFINSDFSKSTSATTFACAIGGRLSVDNCKVNTPDIFDINGTSNSGGDNWPVDLEVGKLTYGPRVTGFAKTALLDTNTNQNVFNFINTEVPASINIFTVANGTNGIPKVKKGAMIILGNTPPLVTTHAFKGDIYRLNNAAIEAGKPYEWLCTTTVGFSRTASMWIPTKWQTARLATTALPVLTSLDVGVENFDTTLNKFTKWSGTAWV